MTPSDKSRGGKSGEALGEARIWDSACARLTLVTELFLFCTKYALAGGSSDFSDTGTSVPWCLTDFTA